MLDRRGFLGLGGVLGFNALWPAGAWAAVNPQSASTAAQKLPVPSQAYSVLKRTSFGVHGKALTDIESIGIPAYLQRQLAYESIDDGLLDSVIAENFAMTVATPAARLAGFPANFQTLESELLGATLFRAYFSQRQLYEVMVEFWSNHFSVDLRNGFEPALKPGDDTAVIRPNALGNFRRLLMASAHSPAMLFSLDNFLNTKAAPNENYARELLELHTLGVDGGYTEQDIKEVARCFTGWAVNFATGDFIYIPSVHDTGEKRVLGKVIPAGGQEEDGIAVLNLLAEAPATAGFIARKLCRRLISDTPPEAVVKQVARSFRETGGDIRAMLRTIFASSAFLDTRDEKIDRPIEFVGQIVRALNPSLTLPADKGQLFVAMLGLLGQMPFCWVAPDGFPDTKAHWASTSGLLNRWRVAPFAVSSGMFRLATLQGSASSISTLVDTLATAVLRRPMRKEDRQSLIAWLAGQTGAKPEAILPRSTVDAFTPALVAMLISSPYFQLR